MLSFTPIFYILQTYKAIKLDKYFVANGASGETEKEKLDNKKLQTNFRIPNSYISEKVNSGDSGQGCYPLEIKMIFKTSRSLQTNYE